MTNKRLQADQSAQTWVSRISALALIAQIVLSRPLWSGTDRTFPQIPFWGAPGLPDSQTGMLLAAISLLVLAVLIWKPSSKPAVVAVLSWFAGMVLLDLNRLQPWLYYYMALWTFSLFDPAEARKGKQWTIAAVYVWGGIWKFTPYFAEDNFAWFCEAFRWSSSLGQFPALGYCIAVAEALLGIGLLWPRTRKLAVWFCLTFHGFIVLALSPLGLDWNAVVIPWNLAMMAHIWLLFRYPDAVSFPQHIPAFALVVWIWLAPVLARAGWSPLAMAWTMYSNTQPEWNIYVDQGLVCDPMKPIWSAHAYDRKSKLLLDDWAMANLRVPAINSAFAIRKLGKYWCGCVEEKAYSGILCLKVHPFKREQTRVDTISCSR